MLPTSLSLSKKSTNANLVEGVCRSFGSLRLATLLIVIYAAVIAAATVWESEFGSPAVRFAVYETPGFFALNILLAFNVFMAAAVRFPWRRSQTGFVVTHVGILVLMLGAWFSLRFGVETQLAVYEGRSAHRAYSDSLNLELSIAADSNQTEETVISIPFPCGPLSWSDYDRRLPKIPFGLASLPRGVRYDEEGVRLEVLDYRIDLEDGQSSRAQVRLTVDGNAEEFWLTGPAESPPRKDQVVSVKGKNRLVRLSMPYSYVDLGFDVHLREFRRRLEPGGGKPTLYASAIDVVDRSQPGKLILCDAFVALNSPLEIVDPLSGVSWRIFQSSFSGPWRPGSKVFDALVADGSRDQLFLSRFSVNSDPGRPLKYFGGALLVFGVALTYYFRVREKKDE